MFIEVDFLEDIPVVANDDHGAANAECLKSKVVINERGGVDFSGTGPYPGNSMGLQTTAYRQSFPEKIMHVTCGSMMTAQSAAAERRAQ